jgi:(1->4)-alpha-D-glucan 1-alpha-D-glucosylmutase
VNDESALLELAAHHGIETGYHDIWGTWRALSTVGARTLLEALGVAAHDDDAVSVGIARAADRDWQTLLPPVVVVRDGDVLQVPVCVDVEGLGVGLQWTVHWENGDETHGEAQPEDLQILAERDGGAQRRLALPLALDLPPGYHRVCVRRGATQAQTVLIHTPRRCAEVPTTRVGGRPWGVTLQLYALRSARNWGMGDFGDLAAAVDALAELGADMVGLNPLHALFPATPSHASPYSPASRYFLNSAYLHVESLADYRECPTAREEVESAGFQARLDALRTCELVDYEAAIPLKLDVLRRLFEHFRREHLARNTQRRRDFARFVERGGESLRRFAVFQCLHRMLQHQGHEAWPEQFRDSDSPAVETFARQHATDVAFQQYLQWITRAQLDEVAAHAHARGMCVGLYLDLAVGSDGHGADAWAEPGLYAQGVSVGAPPDDFSPAGQVWGLPPWRPEALRETAYEPFARCLRANMRNAGAIRIDHVLGLMRLFWVPAGADTAQGAYVRYHLEELLAIMALESRRAGCVVVGEDLGTVPPEVRGALHELGVLSYRVLYFEKHWDGDHSFRQPDHYPELALVTVSTHDLATFSGYWTGRDLDIRDALDLFPSPEMAARQRETRRHDRERLLQALERQGLLPDGVDARSGAPPEEALMAAVHRYLARTPAALFSVQLEDLLGEVEQVNVPGTVAEHPNWRRKLALPVEDWSRHPGLGALAAAITAERTPH